MQCNGILQTFNQKLWKLTWTFMWHFVLFTGAITSQTTNMTSKGEKLHGKSEIYFKWVIVCRHFYNHYPPDVVCVGSKTFGTNLKAM